VTSWEQAYSQQLRVVRAGELAGSCEFDWFAIDSNDRIGVFITASWGLVPRAAVPARDELYVDVMRRLHHEEGHLWSDPDAEPMYDAFYVYEWSRQARGAYRRKSKPLRAGADIEFVRPVAYPLIACSFEVDEIVVLPGSLSTF
jgi:hypothetical protein